MGSAIKSFIATGIAIVWGERSQCPWKLLTDLTPDGGWIKDKTIKNRNIFTGPTRSEKASKISYL